MGRGIVAIVAGLSLLALPGCATGPSRQVRMSIPHFFSVDQKLYRGGQPTEQGFRELARMGVKTVVDLRAEDTGDREQERQLTNALGMEWVHLPMRMYWRPSDDQVLAFLRVVADPSRQPVFVHCRKGEDRTGTLVAIYRITQQGWTPERAYAEARFLGLTGLNPFMRHVILRETSREYVPFVASSVTN